MLAAAALLITAGLLLRLRTYQQWSVILEATQCVGGLSLLVAHQPLRKMLDTLPSLQRRFLFCLVSLMVVTQIWSRTQKSFPIIP